jgi:hypothetical protein
MSFYESPVFVSILLHVIYALLAVAVVIMVWSMVRSLRQKSGGDSIVHGIAVRRIAIATALLLLTIMALTWLLASTTPLTINSRTYDDPFWLRASDMLINTSIILIVLAAIGVALGMAGVSRKMGSKPTSPTKTTTHNTH